MIIEGVYWVVYFSDVVYFIISVWWVDVIGGVVCGGGVVGIICIVVISRVLGYRVRVFCNWLSNKMFMFLVMSKVKIII